MVDGGQDYNSRVVEDQLPALFKSITITEADRSKLREGLNCLFEAEVDDNEELKKAEARLAKLERMEKNLQRLVIEEKSLTVTSRSTALRLRRRGQGSPTPWPP